MVLILGCGNPDRSDDAAGLLVARRLRDLGIDAHEHRGESLALVEEWTGGEEVILVDAIMSGAPCGSVRVWDASRDRLPPDLFPCSTHALGVAEAVELARALGRLPARLTIYGIEAARFEPGGAVSPEVLDAVERVSRRIAAQFTCVLAASPAE